MKMKIRNKTAFTDEVTPLEKENAQVSYEAALEGIVLMENDGTLPLKPAKCAVRSRSRHDDQGRYRFGRGK